MMTARIPTPAIALLAAASLASGTSAEAQGVVVDQGTFALTLDGRDAGTEEFVIRRAGLGSGDAIFASAVVRLTRPAQQQIRPLLRVLPLTGAAEEYQVSVTGSETADIRLGRVGRRYVATIRSSIGAEDREFQARPDTRVLESGVAHHYYFLKDDRGGREAFALEPRTRRQLTLAVADAVQEELRLGPNVVDARRVVFRGDDDDERIVWYDRQGRVLRVEIPNLRYVAERTDLVG